jgi:hypothetical protein
MGSIPPRTGKAAIHDGLAQRFAPATWKKTTHSYANPPLEFIGPKPGCTHPYGRLPSVLGLFEKFWSHKLLRKFFRETNRYASEIIDNIAKTTRGGLD